MLYLCATPIGNLEDITLRVLRVLSEADFVWAEDTRRTLNLLKHYDIKIPLISYHEHNAKERERQFLELMREDKVVAYCSDAGMPGISDPGCALVTLCIEHAIPFTVLPGASAVLTAAVLSGLDCSGFLFLGFLPREKKHRRLVLESILKNTCLTVLYESPLRVPATLNELKSALGSNRKAALCRELSKLHEESARGTLLELSERYSTPPKGECVIVIEGSTTQEAQTNDVDEALGKLIEAGFSPSDAAMAASIALKVKKNAAYKRAIDYKACRK